MDYHAPLHHLPRPRARRSFRLDLWLFMALLLLTLLFLGFSARELARG
jgi:hypothetical protein